MANIDADFENKNLTKNLLEEHLSEIEKLTFYMADTIQSFNNYLQPNQEKEIFSMQEAFENSFELVQKLLESQQIVSNINITDNSFVRGVKKEFVQALLVILNNAKDILIERKIKNKNINISIYTKDNKAILEIKDNAGGVSAKNFNKIFDPYFTTKPHSQGTGHGLCMAKMIIEKSMHGNLDIQNEKEGAKFSIILNKE